MDIVIRNEKPEDFRAVEELTREAFWNLYVPGCDEHYTAHILRSHPDFVPELDCVAVLDGEIVGSIMYTRSHVIDENGRRIDTLTFGPLCVHPEHQRKGIGTALINHTKRIAESMDCPAIIIYGDPHNYCVHGFKSSKEYGITNAEGRFPFGLLVLELKKSTFDGYSWTYHDSGAYHFDPIDAEAFDAGFAPKKKEYRYTQELFSIGIRSFLD